MSKPDEPIQDRTTPRRMEAMLNEARKLVALLSDPQPGHFTWHEAVHNTMHTLNEVYEK